jgi:hypothetical protein
MLLQCYMQNTATSKVVENEMQVKSSCAQGQPKSITPMMIIMVRPNFLGQELPPCRLTYFLFEGQLCRLFEKHRFLKLSQKDNQDQYQSERHTIPFVLVAMMYCLRRFVNPSPSLSSTNCVQLHPTPTPPSPALPFTNPSNHLPPSDLLP